MKVILNQTKAFKIYFWIKESGKLIKNGLKNFLTGSGLTSTNNKIVSIIKVIKSLEIRDILLKKTTRTVINQTVGFFRGFSWFVDKS